MLSKRSRRIASDVDWEDGEAAVAVRVVDLLLVPSWMRAISIATEILQNRIF